MSDTFANFTTGLESPATHILSVTPDDAADLPIVSRALNAGTGGTVTVTTLGGTTATIFLAAGVAFPVRATRIWATGTSATDLVAMY